MNDINQTKIEINKLTRVSFICASIGIVLVWGIFLGSTLLINLLEDILSTETLEFLNSQTIEAIMFYILLSGLIFSALALFLGIISIISHLVKRRKGKFIGKENLTKSFSIDVLSLVALFVIFVVMPNPPRPSLPRWEIRVKVESAMFQIRVEAEIIKNVTGGYSLLSCDYNHEMRNLCDDIEKLVGSKITIHSTEEAYCAYIKLASQEYYCVDNTLVIRRATTNPNRLGYCDGITFICPLE